MNIDLLIEKRLEDAEFLGIASIAFALFESDAGNDPEFVAQLVSNNINFARSLAYKMAPVINADVEDVVSQAMTGLVRAARYFRQGKAVNPQAFIPFAKEVIINELKRLQHNEFIRDPLHSVSLDEPIGGADDGNATRLDRLSNVGDEVDVVRPDEYTDRSDIIKYVRDAMNTLSPEERDIVNSRHFGDSAFYKIGKKYGYSDSTALVKYRQAIKKIKNYLTKHGVTQELSGSFK